MRRISDGDVVVAVVAVMVVMIVVIVIAMAVMRGGFGNLVLGYTQAWHLFVVYNRVFGCAQARVVRASPLVLSCHAISGALNAVAGIE